MATSLTLVAKRLATFTIMMVVALVAKWLAIFTIVMFVTLVARGYYLGDGIYPDWAMLVKAPHNPIDEPRKQFKCFQESARKDIERAFGVLQGRFAMLKTPARSKDFNKIRRHMYACIVLHNMIQENNGFAIGRREERMIERNPPRRLERDLRDRDARVKEIRDKQVHQQLEADLTEHVWNLLPYFRSANNNE
ncbi:uncharacterized protein [Rutidosis leptorrhynchoides]|uniref:uncharacterized protein n=1 Tax=Rutidosis leptorrhynchoides TaxID=125765 RepID=UPI003A99CCD8